MELTQPEAMVAEVATQDSCPDPLALKLGSLIVDSQDSAVVEFTEEELWFLRRKVSIYAQQSGQPAGLTLKKKVYAELLRLDAIRKTSSSVNWTLLPQKGAADASGS